MDINLLHKQPLTTVSFLNNWKRKCYMKNRIFREIEAATRSVL